MGRGRGPLWVLLGAFVVGVGVLAKLILGWHDRTVELVGRVVWEKTGVRPVVIRRGVESMVPERLAPAREGNLGGPERVVVNRARIFLSDHRVVVKLAVDGAPSQVEALLSAVRVGAGAARIVDVSRE